MTGYISPLIENTALNVSPNEEQIMDATTKGNSHAGDSKLTGDVLDGMSVGEVYDEDFYFNSPALGSVIETVGKVENEEDLKTEAHEANSTTAFNVVVSVNGDTSNAVLIGEPRLLLPLADTALGARNDQGGKGAGMEAGGDLAMEDPASITSTAGVITDTLSSSEENLFNLQDAPMAEDEITALLTSSNAPASTKTLMQDDDHATIDTKMDNSQLAEGVDMEQVMNTLKEAQHTQLLPKEKQKHKKRIDKELTSLRSKKRNWKKNRRGAEDTDDEREDSDKAPLWDQNFEEIDVEGELAQENFYMEALRIRKNKKRGTLTQEEEVDFETVISREKRRRNKVNKDREAQVAEENGYEEVDDDSEPLFVPSGTNLGIRQHQNHRSKEGFTGQNFKYGATHDSGDEDDEDDEATVADTPISKIQCGNPKKTPVASKKRKAKSNNTNPFHTTKKRKGPNMTDIGSMITSNPLARAQHLEEGENDEGRLRISSGDKQKALKKLIASLPQEHQDLARADKSALLKASKEFTGIGSCRSYGGEEEGSPTGWMVKGMKTPLRHFQMLGSAWMRTRENSPTAPYGGLIADEMGMGKTIMMLANIVNGRPPPKSNRECKATLIIVPSTLLNQWFEEIQKHVDVEKNGMVMKWKSSRDSGLHTTNDRGLLCNAFIVLCTYKEATKSCIKIIFPKECQTNQEKEKWLEENQKNYRGLLHKISWLRVIVDEAHCIKNHLTHTSLSIREIQAKYRWAITGTPIHNSPKELYPYFKFLGVSGTGDFQTFSSNYQNNQVGQRRLFAMLNSMMLRRTYGDKLMGEALVKLPRTSQATTWVTFNPIERKVYDLVHQRILENVTNMSRRGSLHKLTYHHVLTMILRLRQAASHLLLVEQSMRDLLTKSDMEELHQLVREQEHGIDQRNKNSILELRRLLKSNEEWKAATYEEPESFMADIEKNYDRKLTTNNTGALYGLSYNFQAYLKKLEDGSRIEEMRESMRCHMCNQDPAKDPYLTECSHIYCKTCITTIGFEAASQGFPARCRVCSRVYKSSAPFDPKKQQEPDGEASGSKNGKPKKSKPRKTSNKGDKDFLMNNPEITPLPSAKTIAIKAQILNWMEENPKVKIIVFTQFLPIISILTRMCDAEGWPSFGFCGDMSIEARDAAIKAFDANDQPCVMVATLKTGGVGLNLTMASKVIIMDPWWNSSVEMQAFGRVFRIGQKKETSLLRVFAEHTIDEKMDRMQQEKTKAIEAIMCGNNDGSARPTTNELLQLFFLGDGDNQFVIANERPDERKKTILQDNAYMMWNKEDDDQKSRRRWC